MIVRLRNAFRQAGWQLAVIAGILLASPLCGRAQTQSNQPSRSARAPVGGAGMRFQPGFERLQTVLTEEQRASLREAMDRQREQLRKLEAQLRSARREIFEAGWAEKFEETLVREKALVASKLEAEVSVLRAKALSEMRPRLTADQIAELRRAPGNAISGRTSTPSPASGRDENDLPAKKAAGPK